MKHHIDIRFATKADVPLILQFIKELAQYEQLLHEVVATEAILEQTLFGPKSHAEGRPGHRGGQCPSLGD